MDRVSILLDARGGVCRRRRSRKVAGRLGACAGRVGERVARARCSAWAQPWRRSYWRRGSACVAEGVAGGEDEVRRVSPRKKTVEMTLGVCRRGGRRPWHATATGDAAAMA